MAAEQYNRFGQTLFIKTMHTRCMPAHKKSEAWFREAHRPAIDREQGTDQRYMALAQETLGLKSEMADLKQQLQQQQQQQQQPQQMGTANIVDKAASSCVMGPKMSTPSEISAFGSQHTSSFR